MERTIYRFEVLGCKLAVSRIRFDAETQYSKEGISVWLDAPGGVGAGGTVGFFIEIPPHDYSREGLIETIREATERRIREFRREHEEQTALNERRRVQQRGGSEAVGKLVDLLTTPE